MNRKDLSTIFDNILFRDFFNEDFFNPLPTLKKIDYPVDIIENKDGLEIDIAAIGLEKSDFKIDIKDDVLSISYINQDTSEQKVQKQNSRVFAYKGITRKDFNFAWRINDKFDLTKTQAELDKGLLKIFIPLAPEKKTKEIEVTIR
jgi:HSP20 family protein